jgi:hypothetical protein
MQGFMDSLPDGGGGGGEDADGLPACRSQLKSPAVVNGGGAQLDLHGPHSPYNLQLLQNKARAAAVRQISSDPLHRKLSCRIGAMSPAVNLQDLFGSESPVALGPLAFVG